MAVLYTNHFIQFLDDDGNPLSGGNLYSYSAGTTTPKATYTSADGATPNANPVVLDSAGRAVVFLSGSYKFRLEDSLGNLIRETDNITAFSNQTSGVDDIVTNFTEDVITASDSIIFADASDSNSTKRDTVQGILDLVPTTFSPTGCSLYQTTGTSIPNTSTWTTMLFDTEEYDDNSYHSTSSNTGRITVDFNGRIDLKCRVNFGASGNASRGIRILKNGATVIGYVDFLAAAGGGLNNTTFNLCIDAPCSASDYFELQAYSNTAGTSGTGIGATSFTFHRIK